MKFAVVIPAYNESKTIRDIALRARKFCELVIVVDDGSTDKTAEQVSDIDIALIVNNTNIGKAGAMWRGIQHALSSHVDAVITIDGDGQHRPEDIPAIIKKFEENSNSVIIGSRLHDKKAFPRKRYLANRFANFWIAWASGLPLEDSQSGFRLYPVSFLRNLSLNTSRENSFVFESEILIEAGWQGLGIHSIQIPAIYGGDLRESHFQSVEDIKKIVRMVAKRLFKKQMNIPGFVKAFIFPARNHFVKRGFDKDAALTFVLSIVVGIITLGITHLYLMSRIIITAVRTPIDGEAFDAITVLGHQLVNGEISSSYRARLSRVVELYNQSAQKPDILIIGGRAQKGTSEAEAGREYLSDNGIPANKIFKEEKSKNSLENFHNARERLLVMNKPIVITNRFHLQRIRTLMSGLGLKIDLVAAENNRNVFRWTVDIMREALFLHWYWTGRFYATLMKNRKMLDRIQ